jgi:hypothetical protein
MIFWDRIHCVLRKRRIRRQASSRALEQKMHLVVRFSICADRSRGHTVLTRARSGLLSCRIVVCGCDLRNSGLCVSGMRRTNGRTRPGVQMSGRVPDGLASDLGASVNRSRTAIQEGGQTDLAVSCSPAKGPALTTLPGWSRFF